ncbi:MAG: DUF447 domain-containing protein [Candidatus Bathyarchaeia archaeon]
MEAVTLQELGFSKGATVETIVTTYTPRGNRAAAPLGVTPTETQLGEVELRPFVSTYNYRNLLFSKAAVLNVTSDPFLFLWTTFREIKPSRKLPTEWFQQAAAVSAPALKVADAHVEVTVVNSVEEGDRAKVRCRVERVEARRVVPQAYSRAVRALMECIIHATRIKVFHATGDEVAVEDLLKLLHHYRSLISRVAPDSAYSDGVEQLFNILKSWGVSV